MSKNSRDPAGRREATDGAISTAELSPTLMADAVAAGGGSGGGGAAVAEDGLSFLLADVDETRLAGLAVGQEVRFAESGRRVAAVATGVGAAIGFVPARRVEAVRRATATAYRAWISELPHKAVRLSVGS